MKLARTILLLFITTVLICSRGLFAQSYQFKNYTVDNGLSQPYVYTLNQGPNGFLWIGTGEGLCKFDGLRFRSYYTKDGLAENFITTSFRDNSRRLWFGHYQGGVTMYDGRSLHAINTNSFAKSPVTCIAGDDKGFVWFATQNDGVFRISKTMQIDTFRVEFRDMNIFSLNFTRNGELLAGTAEGLMVFDLQGATRIPVYSKTLDNIPQTRIQVIQKKNNSTSFWIGTEDEGIFLLVPKEKGSFISQPVGLKFQAELHNIQDIYEDNLSNLWVATFGNGVIKLLLSKTSLQYIDFTKFSEDSGIGNKYTKKIYSDHENNIWVGTYGSGLVQLTDNCFSFFSSPQSDKKNITAVYIDNGIRYTGTEHGFMRSTPAGDEFFSHRNGFADDRVTSFFKSDTSTFIVGTEKSGAFRFDTRSKKFSRIDLAADQLSQNITSITGKGPDLWIGTRNGVFRIETSRHITTHYTTDNGLPHNNIAQVFLDHNNRLLIATHSNMVTYIDQRAEVTHKIIYNGSDLLSITGIIEDESHNIWMATFGNGVFRVADTSVTIFDTENGLKSNYCYSIVEDGSNNIWVGHRLGLSRIKPARKAIELFDKADGITGDCNYNAFFREPNGNVWFGTTDGLVRFDPHKDKKNLVPPIINVTAFRLNDRDIDFARDTTLPSDEYRLRVDFIGISFKPNTRVAYQYKLEGYDPDWSDKTYNNFAQYGRLSEGEYTFLIRAYNSDGVGSQVPLAIHFTISPPFWKRAWFIVIAVLSVLYGFYLIVKTRERSHRRFQAQLQKALNEKTREVIKQKEEIEKKNKDITDSIRYAKRIQDAILPDLEKLKSVFPESFIFFQPRDIVSGDFYWYELYDDKLVIACADATGHGVPGAFMSMIGSTLLKDITSRAEVTSPAHSLRLLDDDVKTLLKQHDDEHEHTHDSIDIVICEINIRTHHVRICSTKRPVFVANGGGLRMLRKENTDHQEYETRDIQLKKGDIIYMFTDGYPDQFGGTQGKKIKVSNLRNVLEQIQSLPMQEQKLAIDRYFNRWKEGHDQVDDVLFIGIQL